MNNKSQTLAIAILSSIVVLILGLTIVNLLTPSIDDARINMNCSSPSEISDGTKLFCLVIDSTIPYWIILVMSLVIGGITARLSIS
jgi:hypothetical protein